ncbi:MAG: electron transporter RnfB [Ignavibacteriales bacterium UTCHB3]|nr:MAG: electron transporter RnfB [Ignavibacteriales bacterium UTCHB3]
MDTQFIIALATMGGLGFIFAGALAIADKKLRVEENHLIGEINEVLPGANCGGCGYAGCYDFAVNVVEGKAKSNGCPVGGSETAAAVAYIMGEEAGEVVRMLPRMLCRGGHTEAVNKLATYYGPLSCSAMDLLSGGDKLCFYGCLGGGDCVVACPFGALVMGENGLPVLIESLCTGCGNCEQACPRHVIEMHPADRKVFVFCKSLDDPKTSKAVCSVSCMGCSICARKSEGGVVMENNLAVINYDQLDPEKVPFDKCSTRAIGMINDN